MQLLLSDIAFLKNLEHPTVIRYGEVQQLMHYDVFAELGRLIETMKKDYMGGMKDTLMRLYDGRPVELLRKDGPLEIKPAYVTVVAATTEARLSDVLRPTDLRDGFFPRYLVVRGDVNGWSPKVKETQAMLNAKAALIDELRQLNVSYCNKTTEMEFAPDARQTFEDWCRSNAEKSERDEIPSPIPPRLEDAFEKVAMLIALSDEMKMLGATYTINRQTVDETVKTMDTYVAGILGMYKRLGSSRNVEAVMDAVIKAGGRLSNAELIAKAPNGLRGRELKDTVTECIESERLTKEYEQSTRKGRFRRILVADMSICQPSSGIEGD